MARRRWTLGWAVVAAGASTGDELLREWSRRRLRIQRREPLETGKAAVEAVANGGGELGRPEQQRRVEIGGRREGRWGRAGLADVGDDAGEATGWRRRAASGSRPLGDEQIGRAHV